MPKTPIITDSTRLAPEQNNPNAVSRYYSKCYEALTTFIGCELGYGLADRLALLIQRIHYWLQNTKAGYRLKDGSKWIFNGYKEWQEQMPWLSVQQIGRLIRRLEAMGWLISDRFYNLKREIGFTQSTPSFHEDNQRKWYRLNYPKIFTDTGFDLLFDSEDQSSPPPPMAETIENSQCSQFSNTLFAAEYSSIYKENTKELSRESEKEGIEFDNINTEVSEVKLNNDSPPPDEGKDGWMESSVDPGKDQSSAAPCNKTLKIVKDVPMMFNPETRPARQDPWLRYPDGPWLTETGYLNEDFVRDRANLWRTGDTPKSQAFGRMPIEEVIGLVLSHYAKPANQANLEIHWAAYVLKNQRYLGNVRQRMEAGINIPLEEQQQVRAKLPAVLSGTVQLVYQLATIDQQAMLPSSQDLPQLPPTVSRVLPPEDGENYQAYQPFNVKQEDADYWRQMYESRQKR